MFAQKATPSIGAMALIAALAMPGMATAEEATGEDPVTDKSSFFAPKIGGIYFSGGVGLFDMSELNDDLETGGYSQMQNPFITLGLGGTIRFGHLVLGGEGHWLRNVGGEAESNDFRLNVSGGYALARVGFDVLQWGGLSIYPIVGIGGGRVRVDILQEGGASFEDVLADPAREVRLTQRALLLDASLGVDYRFEFREQQGRASYFTIGVRGGYLFAPYSGGWRSAGAEISGGPDLDLNGPVVQLMIGFSGKGPRYHQRR
jgi:opacity protein-like surface antigen